MFPNVTVDTYTIEVTMPSFSTLKRTGVPVSAGSRVTVGTLTIELGGATETVEVKAEAPVIQAASGERSFTIPTESVQNLPLANRSFHTLATLAPGVSGTPIDRHTGRDVAPTSRWTASRRWTRAATRSCCR